MAHINRTFYPGDKWVYFKYYTGVKTADTLLMDYLHPVAKMLLRKNIIQKWFFIRYNDTAYHLRFRLLVDDEKKAGEVLYYCHKALKKAYSNGLVDLTQLDTYVRELERYGKKTMDLSETIFYYDSDCCLDLLKYLRRKNENYRWMIALTLIDEFFNDVAMDLNKRAEWLERMSDSFRLEFGYNMHNAKQLNDIYRNKKKAVELALSKEPEDEEIVAMRKIIQRRSRRIKSLLRNEKFPEEHVSSFIHMMMNRLFRSKNRMHELLIYDFLNRYYKSEIAKQKHKK